MVTHYIHCVNVLYITIIPWQQYLPVVIQLPRWLVICSMQSPLWSVDNGISIGCQGDYDIVLLLRILTELGNEQISYSTDGLTSINMCALLLLATTWYSCSNIHTRSHDAIYLTLALILSSSFNNFTWQTLNCRQSNSSVVSHTRFGYKPHSLYHLALLHHTTARNLWWAIFGSVYYILHKMAVEDAIWLS